MGNFAFILNGVVFILIRFDLPETTKNLHLEGISIEQATLYEVFVTIILVLVRLFSSYSAVIITKFMSKFINVADTRNPGKRTPFVLGWTGMRGVVSLASALSIPLTLPDGSAFPHRSLILYITFVVIILTLVVQGLTLPWIISKIKFPDFSDYMDEKESENLLHKEITEQGLTYIKKNKNGKQVCEDEVLQRLVSFWQMPLDRNKHTLSVASKNLYLATLHHQRMYLYERNKNSLDIDEEVVRKFIRSIDLEEERARNDS